MTKRFCLKYMQLSILILWAMTTMFPFLWVVMNSFKTSQEIMSHSFSFPKELNIQNYMNVFDRQNLLTSYQNSLIISVSVTLLVVLLSTMMAFGMTRYQFRGKSYLYVLILVGLLFPPFSTIIPVFKRMNTMGLLNNPISVILPQVASNLSFATIVMMGFLREIPLELEEASYVEGANIGYIFLKVILPLSKPAMGAVAIFCFLWSYNDLFAQMIMIRKRTKFPISALLNEIGSKYGTDYGLMTAAVTLITIPVLIVYLILLKNITKGLTTGAVKG